MQKFADRLVVLGTGGTIAGTSADPGDHTGYRAGSLTIAQLLQKLPGIDTTAIDSEQVAQIDSKDMDHATWQRLAQRIVHHSARSEVGAIVVTHGTDTLEETAYFLHRVLPANKPVVLTAAMRPATALHPDGPQNLLDAAMVARSPGARGVVAVIAGKLIGGADLRKLHPYRLDAFGSGDAGLLGVVEEGRLRLFRAWPAGCDGGGADASGAGARSGSMALGRDRDQPCRSRSASHRSAGRPTGAGSGGCRDRQRHRAPGLAGAA